jgi:DNA-binding NtrC family response regulator
MLAIDRPFVQRAACNFAIAFWHFAYKIACKMKPTIIRLFAWKRNVAQKAMEFLEKVERPDSVDVQFFSGSFVDDCDRLFAESDWRDSPSNPDGNSDLEQPKQGFGKHPCPIHSHSATDSDQFHTWCEKRIEMINDTIGRQCESESEKTDIFIFLLDDIPLRLVPVITLLWNQRIMAYFRKEPDFSENTLPCHLAVMDENSKSQFNMGCADAQVLFDQLKDIRSFSLDAPILLEGPTGTGKSFFAEFLHRMTAQSKPANSKPPFERVNLGELSEDSATFTSRIVGHVKGSFTGATEDREGVLLACQDGTVFFDELDGLSIQNQIRLLTYTDDIKGDGFLHAQRFGATKDQPFKRCNMIFATNKPVELALRKGRLRPDFLYRFRDTVSFCGLQDIFERTGADGNAQLMAYICFFLMKLRANVEKEPERFWSMPFLLQMRDRETLRSMREFHWSGNFRTIEKFCRHLLSWKAFNPRSTFVLKDEWPKWKEHQYNDTGLDFDGPTSLSSNGGKVSLPRSGKGPPKEIFDLYKGILKRALDLSKSDGNGKPNETIAAKILGIDTRTFKKKLKEFDLES